jgi:hypothetical protein
MWAISLLLIFKDTEVVAFLDGYDIDMDVFLERKPEAKRSVSTICYWRHI